MPHIYSSPGLLWLSPRPMVCCCRPCNSSVLFKSKESSEVGSRATCCTLSCSCACVACLRWAVGRAPAHHLRHAQLRGPGGPERPRLRWGHVRPVELWGHLVRSYGRLLALRRARHPHPVQKGMALQGRLAASLAPWSLLFLAQLSLSGHWKQGSCWSLKLVCPAACTLGSVCLQIQRAEYRCPHGFPLVPSGSCPRSSTQTQIRYVPGHLPAACCLLPSTRSQGQAICAFHS